MATMRTAAPDIRRRAPNRAAVALLATALSGAALPAQLPPSVREVHLRVTDAKGGPIQDLRVRVCGALPNSPRLRLLPGVPQRTLGPKDFADGFARLRDLPDGDLVLIVESDGHALAVSETFTLPARAPARMTVRMGRGATLRGKVTAPDGTPVPDAVVRTLGRDADNQHPFAAVLGQMFVVPATSASTRTAADGSFQLTNVAAGDYVVRATHPDWADARSELEVKGKGEKDVGKLALRPGGVVTGAVQRDGARLAGVVVILQSPLAPDARPDAVQAVRIEVRTGADGTFSFPRVPFGSYQLCAHEGGDPIAQAMQQSASMRDVEVRPRAEGEPQQELLLLPKSR